MKKIEMLKNKIKSLREEAGQDGFSLLELVVAVGILLVLTVGGLLAYNGITDNARDAAVQTAASEVFTGAVAYESDNDSTTDAALAVSQWNGSADGKIVVEDASTADRVVIRAYYMDDEDTTYTTAEHKSERSEAVSGE